MRLAGFVCLFLAIGFLAAATSRYTVQPANERGPFVRTLTYGLLGIGLAVAAFALIPGER